MFDKKIVNLEHQIFSKLQPKIVASILSFLTLEKARDISYGWTYQIIKLPSLDGLKLN